MQQFCHLGVAELWRMQQWCKNYFYVIARSAKICPRIMGGVPHDVTTKRDMMACMQRKLLRDWSEANGSDIILNDGTANAVDGTDCLALLHSPRRISRYEVHAVLALPNVRPSSF